MTRPAELHADIAGFTPETLAVRADFQTPRKPLATLRFGALTIEARPGIDTLWIVIRRQGKGAVALRAIPAVGPIKIGARRASKNKVSWKVETASGVFTVVVALLKGEVLRLAVRLTPASDLLVSFWPRDVFVLDAQDDPTGAKGWVEAAQRGLNGGLCYFCLEKPAFGRVLYMQDLTALNPYFAATKTKPDGVVGGEWPELGYQPPTAPMGPSPPIHPLPANQTIMISDALLAFRPSCSHDERESARDFLEMLCQLYPHLAKPEPQHHDWIARSEQTLRDLARAGDAKIDHYGHTYLHPYTGAEYPDSMVQMTVTASIRDWEGAFNKTEDLADALFAGMGRFFDKDLGMVRRYLPNVGDDKNKDAVDSWYLYHPLLNLGRLALRGDAGAERLFRGSLEYAVKAARHFNYNWPIQYDVNDFSVITAARNAQGLGQTDVGGLYAYVMVQAFELTREEKYLKEAKAALGALKEMRFELAYQTNLTAWGATACMKLYVLEKDESFIAQSLVFVAGFLHNCVLWSSDIEHAKHYVNFLGATCLHDAPYMAAYECFESFAAFNEYLVVGGAAVPAAVKLLICEYRRYALDRAWYFYPDALPKDALAQDKIRNGYIDRGLSFPLEDLYADGQPAGQVGQEIYGCGGAFVFAAGAYFDCGDTPFRLFCDYPAILDQGLDDTVTLRLQGPPGQTGRVMALRKGRRTMPRIVLRRADAQEGETVVTAKRRSADWRDYSVRADDVLTFSWSRTRASASDKER